MVKVTQNIANRVYEEEEEGLGFEERILREYWKYCDTIFDKKTFNKLLLHRPWDHAIEIIPEASLKNCRIYPLLAREQQKLNRFLNEHLKTERIQPSKSPCTVSFFFIKKKDSFLWLVQDYRQLNEVIVKNRYSLSLIQESVDTK